MGRNVQNFQKQIAKALWRNFGEENTNDEPPRDIQLLGATAFSHLIASEAVVEAFPVRLGECQGLLGASREGTSKGEGNSRMRNGRAEAAAVVAAAE